MIMGQRGFSIGLPPERAAFWILRISP